MKRKTVAVCVTGYNWECESRIIYGLYKKCMELDINLLAFATLMRKPELNSDRILPESIIRGETEIFSLINYDLIDGIVLMGDTIIDEDTIRKIVKCARSRNIPVVNVNDPNHDIGSGVFASDKEGMEYVMRHLIDVHGFTRINFIGGFPGNPQTEERLAAYKKILTEHDIPVEESRIAYGEFWKKAADCTAEFLKADEIPQAIVCANDTMAFFCMDQIKEHGLRIPEDIAVTGFDGIKDCEAYKPALTTVRQDHEQMGEAALDIIMKAWEGEKSPECVYIESKLVVNESCGCVIENHTAKKDFYTERYREMNDYMAFNTYILEMNTRFASASTSAELYTDVVRGAEFFSLNRLYLCICSNVENGKGVYDPDEIRPKFIGLSDTMVSMLEFGHNIPVGTEFPSAELVPESILDGEKAVFFAFSPIYFKDTFLGYLAYEPTGIEGNGDFFITWITSISNNAGSFYMKNELEYVVAELENLYIRDPLTGLYNRRGMSRLGKHLIESAKYSGGSITMICADIDGLKPINDVYGHEAGDNAILQTAKAIDSSVPEGSISVRTGGDEFCIILDCGEEKTEEYIAGINAYLDEYNRSSGLPYKVGCSCGSYSISAEKIISIEDMMKTADENMYRTKAEKKAGRK